jgi:hypothetical protein
MMDFLPGLERPYVSSSINKVTWSYFLLAIFSPYDQKRSTRNRSKYNKKCTTILKKNFKKCKTNREL